MRPFAVIAIAAAALGAARMSAPVDSAQQQDRIIALERAALDRWGKGDPEGYLSNYSDDVTYFDPFQPRRVDGIATMRKFYEPIAGKVHVDSFAIVAPKVQLRGDMAVLSYNLVSHGRKPDGDTITVRWNSTAVYARAKGTWKEIHSHWSFTSAGANMPATP